MPYPLPEHGAALVARVEADRRAQVSHEQQERARLLEARALHLSGARVVRVGDLFRNDEDPRKPTARVMERHGQGSWRVFWSPPHRHVQTSDVRLRGCALVSEGVQVGVVKQ